MRIRILAILITAGCFSLTGCETISEDDCKIGAWSEYGYDDGLNGRPSDRISDYAKRCQEFGVKPDMEVYLDGYNLGIKKYCTYEQGYERGENGESYNQACSGPLAVDFAPGYDEGRAVYEIYEEHKTLIARYDDVLEDLDYVQASLNDPTLSGDERARLVKKERRLKREADDHRIDIRAFERLHNLPRHSFY